jgi:protein-tyrosine-phosphatase
MKVLNKIFFLSCFLSVMVTAAAQDVVELKQPLSNKIIIKLMFRNGSISDPAGKQGLTYTTAFTVIEVEQKIKLRKRYRNSSTLWLLVIVHKWIKK